MMQRENGLSEGSGVSVHSVKTCVKAQGYSKLVVQPGTMLQLYGYHPLEFTAQAGYECVPSRV